MAEGDTNVGPKACLSVVPLFSIMIAYWIGKG